MINDIMKNLLKERPVGSKNNMDILQYLGQHRTMETAAFAESFGPIVQCEKREIHPVFPLFPHFPLGQILSAKALAPLCGIALEKMMVDMGYVVEKLPLQILITISILFLLMAKSITKPVAKLPI